MDEVWLGGLLQGEPSKRKVPSIATRAALKRAAPSLAVSGVQVPYRASWACQLPQPCHRHYPAAIHARFCRRPGEDGSAARRAGRRLG